ncbi:acetyl-CoA acetyltransferase [Halorubrum distributum JCM 9100]|uniref:acetyl-CoA C-acyltransferase n=5 Tax=Halorubrum distributum TaxID=29283 RepID=M0EEY7_9EURY|nr:MULTISPECIES: thiolase family protein [Halorubrum distributum group]PHQ46921.1 acetyl-CoA acetyltransferase [Halorubrum sp. C3]ELZ30021.1 acetyl-CoA acetyltransferase [Halorubrum terrestre JCM 10247]ELZ45452.1 acetyl-CoA acetyltransferase [Halorubrum distributum JCM 9100]ELZ56147.1 acetyl-CoA acetyltransferase [Halorubrum distributum JCM 10118]EMA57423.1 acetyl-CoA acetyltransferase [Halorubrum litoreum JCM 13561]
MTDETTPVIAAAYRTPQGKEGGVYEDVRSEDLSTTLIDHALDETGLTSDHVDDLMWGVAQQRTEQDNNVARVIALLSDLGESVPATSINRWCASSMQAVISASDAIAAGNRDCIIAGGVENMSRVPMDGDSYEHLHPELSEQYNIFQLQMGMTAEKVAEEYDVSREAQDEYAARSHQRAAEATESGRFDDEIVPVETDDGLVEADEGIRPDTTAEKLADLPPAFTGDGTVTAGNSSQISDGASLTVVTSKAFAEEHGLDVLAEVGTNNVAGVDPTVMGIGPVPATRGLLERAGTDIDDYDLVELNEAFASQCEYSRRELGIDEDSYNVNGGAIALGHPLGASGARLPVTLLHEMQKQDAERGLATLCVGFGQGAAIEFLR